MLLRPAPVPIRQFTWLPAERLFVGEISSTHGLGRVWDDSCDEGLTIVATSGNEVVFAVEKTLRNDEGEMTGWELRPAVRTGPNADLRLLLLND